MNGPRLAPTPLSHFIERLLFAESDIRKSVQETREALPLSGAVPLVVVRDIGTVRKPEAWLAVLDHVRKEAQARDDAEMLFHMWDWFRRGCTVLDSDCLRWIVLAVEKTAKEAGLISDRVGSP